MYGILLQVTTNPKTIMNELELIYSNLFSEENSGHSSSFLDDLKEFPTWLKNHETYVKGR